MSTFTPKSNVKNAGDAKNNLNLQELDTRALIQRAQQTGLALDERDSVLSSIASKLERAKKDSGNADLPSSHDLARKVLNLYLDYSEKCKAKTSRRLQSALVNLLLKSEEPSELAPVVEHLALLRHEINQDDVPSRSKAALQVFAACLQKDTSCLRSAFGTPHVTQATKENEESARRDVQTLLQELFRCMHSEYTLHAACRAILATMKACSITLLDTDGKSPGDLDSVWIELLREEVQKQPALVDDVKHYLLPDLFAMQPRHGFLLLEMLGIHDVFARRDFLPITQRSESDWALLFAALDAGKSGGVIQTYEGLLEPAINFDGKHIFIPQRAIHRLLRSNSSMQRLAGLSLIVISHSSTKSLSPGDVRALKTYLRVLFSEVDSDVRGDILACLQRLVDRLRGVILSLSRKTGLTANKHSCIDVAGSLRLHQDFLTWLIRFTSNSLHPAANYQLHFFSLRTLLIVAKCGVDKSICREYLSKQAQLDVGWTFNVRLYSETLISKLLDLLLNPFDDIRGFSATLLEMLLRPVSPLTERKMINMLDNGFMMSICAEQKQLPGFLDHAQDLARSSGRADHADGLSRAFALFYATFEEQDKAQNPNSSRAHPFSVPLVVYLIHYLTSDLIKTLNSCKTNVLNVIHSSPVHARLSSLKYLLESPAIANEDEAVFTIWGPVQLLELVWETVRDTLCNDAPEGYIPDEVSEVEDADMKSVLSYSWRALKESSSLMRVILLKTPMHCFDSRGTQHSDGQHLDLEKLVKLCFVQLTELRHRGAFAAVAQAFAAGCFRCRLNNRPDLLVQVYKDALATLGVKGSKITRRSAGLPMIFTGILSAESPSLPIELVIRDLDSAARAPIEPDTEYGGPLPQVHALNCLKAIFIAAKLGPASAPFIPLALDLAGNCFASRIWSVRNCGIMLFRALVDRLLGSTDTQRGTDQRMHTRFSWKGAPGLSDTVSKLLQSSTERPSLSSNELEGVFPVLQLLQRVAPPPNSLPDVRRVLLVLCQNPHWHVRDMAARTLVSLLPSLEHELSEIVALGLPSPGELQNTIHGKLLFLKYYLHRHLPKFDDAAFKSLLSVSVNHFEQLYANNDCAITQSAYLDVLNAIMAHAIRENIGNVKLPLLDSRFTNLGESARLGISSALYYLLHTLISTDLSSVDASIAEISLSASESCISSDLICLLEEVTTHFPVTSKAWITTRLAQKLYDLCLLQPTKAVHARLYRLLADVSDSCGQINFVFPPELYRTVKDAVIGGDATQNAMQSAIRLWGYMLGKTDLAGVAGTGIEEELRIFLAIVEQLQDENLPFDMRFAAILALSQLSNTLGLSSSDRLEGLTLRAACLTYTALNDDDEEIRDQAAVLQGWLLKDDSTTPKEHLAPLAASRKLAIDLVSRLPRSSLLLRVAVERTIGSRVMSGSVHPSVQHRFSSTLKEGTALFAIEKQNLYLDPTREAVIWSTVLKRLSPPNFGSESILALSVWTVDGLDLIITTATTRKGGALGWASKPDMFVLGVQILFAARVLLKWRSQSRKVPVKASALLATLARVQMLGVELKVHHMWAELAGKILEELVLLRLQRVARTLGVLEQMV